MKRIIQTTALAAIAAVIVTAVSITPDENPDGTPIMGDGPGIGWAGTGPSAIAPRDTEFAIGLGYVDPTRTCIQTGRSGAWECYADANDVPTTGAGLAGAR